jgi:release factor glutamine methyltransferase
MMASIKEGVALSLSSLIASLEESLSRAGISSPRAEAEMIAGHVLGLKRADLYLRGEEEVAEPEGELIMELAARRLGRYPLQYITGECEFMSLGFAVREGVFIPRPETEVLVESVVGRAGAGKAEPRALLEVGTGCGVICISLGREMSGLRAVATDVSMVAVETAMANAARHGVENRMRFAVGDGISFFREGGPDGVNEGRWRGFDLFVCNPPYVATSEIAGLEPEVRDHEPRAAVDGGEDGLEFMRRIIPGLPSIMSRGALLAFEIAPDQGETVSRLLARAGGVEIEVIEDLSKRDRVVIARMA